jgi:hypothetical protein
MVALGVGATSGPAGTGVASAVENRADPPSDPFITALRHPGRLPDADVASITPQTESPRV